MGRVGPTIDLGQSWRHQNRGLQPALGLSVPKTETLPSNKADPMSATFLETPSLWACPFPHTQSGYQPLYPAEC